MMDSHQQEFDQYWLHSHDYVKHNHRGERRARWVFALTFVTMWVEIVAGMQFHSMALLADGWHMSTHAAAFLITLMAYRYGRLHRNDHTFAFSPAKVDVLGGFASSIALAMVALMMIMQSVERLLVPQLIQFDEAIIVAAVGLSVNILSALLLNDHDHHHHSHSHQHDHHGHHHHHDHNLRAAYLHVIADALTSFLAIIALMAGKYYGWNWLDPVMGLVGALVILVWAGGLVRETAPVLVDHSVPFVERAAISALIEAENDCKVVDLHVWRMTAHHHAAVIAIVSTTPQSPEVYRKRLKSIRYLDHVTIEVHHQANDRGVA
jgi:cation diffusion facilitator family transporter